MRLSFRWSAVGFISLVLVASAFAGRKEPHQSAAKPVVVWTKQISNSGSSIDAAVLDSTDSLYIVGATRKRLYGKNRGGMDAYVARISTTGRLLWGRQFGLRGNDSFNGAAIDHRNRLYVTGEGSDFMDQATESIRVVEITSSGKKLRSRSLGECYGNTFGMGVAVTKSGSLYVVGSDNTDMPSSDVFRLNANWQVVWHSQIPYSMHGDDYSSAANGVALDQSGNAYVVGGTEYDKCCGFLVKLSSVGKELWHQDFRSKLGSDTVGRNAVTLDAKGNIFVAGGTRGSNSGAFLAKLDSKGNQLLLSRPSETRNGTFTALATDKAGNVYVAGDTRIASSGSDKPFSQVIVIKYGPQGGMLWSKTFESGRGNHASGIAVDRSGFIYVVGTRGCFTDRSSGFVIKLKQ